MGKVGEKSRMTYPAKAPPRSRNFVLSNNRNEADKFKNESAEQISLFQTCLLLRPSESFSSS